MFSSLYLSYVCTVHSNLREELIFIHVITLIHFYTLSPELGKGKRIDQEEVIEKVKLKPTIKDEASAELSVTEKPKKLEEKQISVEKDYEDKEYKLEPLKPFDFESEDIPKEDLPKSDDDKEILKPIDEKPKHKKKKKSGPIPEIVEKTLELSKPKPSEDETEDDISLHYKQKPKPEEPTEEITLKPIKKDKTELDQPDEATETIKLTVKPDDEEQIVEEESVKLKLKKKKRKPSKHDEQEDETEITIANISLKKDIPVDDVEAQLKLKPDKAIVSVEESASDLTLTVEPKQETEPEIVESIQEESTKPDDKEQIIEDESVKLKLKKKKRKPSKPDEQAEETEVTIAQIPLKKDTPIDDVEAEFKLKPDTKIETIDEAETVLTVKFEKPSESAEDEQNIVVKLKSPVEKQEDQDIDESTEFTIGKPKEKPVEDTSQEIKLKKKKKKQTKDVEAAELSISKEAEIDIEEAKPIEHTLEEQKPDEIDDIDDVKIKKKLKKTESNEETTDSKITLEKPTEQPSDEVEAKISVKKAVKFEESDTAETVKIPEIQSEEEKEEEIAAEFTIKKKKEQKPVVEEHTDEYTIKKLKKRRSSQVNIPEYTDVEHITLRPKSTKTKEDIEQEFNIMLDSYAEEEISMSGKIKLKKPKQLTYSEDADEANIKITEEYEDKEGPIIEQIDDDLSGAEDTMYDVDEPDEFSDIEELPDHVEFKLKTKKAKYVVEDHDEEFAVGYTHRKRQDVVSYGEDSFTLRTPSRKLPSSYLEGKVETIDNSILL